MKSAEASTFEGPIEYRDVNVGERAFAIHLGGESVGAGKMQFQADPYESRDKTKGKGSISTTNEDISAQTHEQIYQTQRQGKEMTYVLPLANGRYDVTLYFVEDEWEQNKKRLFNVFLQENQVLHEFDIHAESGGNNVGITKTFRNVPVGNQRLYLDLEGVKRNSTLAKASLAGVFIKRVRKTE